MSKRLTEMQDETQYSGRMLKERPKRRRPEDQEGDEDEVAVYGSDDDDVVTGDEMDFDGNYDPNQGERGDMNNDSDEFDGDDLDSNIDFSSDEDDLGDFEGDEEGLDDDKPMDMDGEDYSDDDDMDMDKGDDQSDLELFHQFKSLLTQIVQSDNPDMEGDELEDTVEEAVNYFLSEDASFAAAMNEHARRDKWEPSDVDQLIEDIKASEPSSESYVSNHSISKNKWYKTVQTEFNGIKVINIVESFDLGQTSLEESHELIERENRAWKAFYSNLVGTFDPATGAQDFENPDVVENKFNELKKLHREFKLFDGRELLKKIREAKHNPNMYVFARDLGESYMAKINEMDTKSLSNKTRKTHKGTTDAMPFDINKILASVLNVQFKGNVKSFKDLGAGVKAGFTGKQASARRGDNRSGGDKTAGKVEATLKLINTISELNTRQTNALLKSFDSNYEFKNIISDSVQYDFDDDFNAIKTAAEGEGLSEGFLSDTKTIFESALKTKINEIATALDINYNQKLRKEVDAIQESVVTKLDDYLDYAVDNYIEENRLVIEQGVRTEISESLLNDMYSVLRRHNVSVPEGKENMLESSKQNVSTLQEELKETTRKAMAYKKKATAFMKEAVNSRFKKDLTVKQQNELDLRTENLEFKNEKDYENKVKDIKRLYFEESFRENKTFINNDDYENGVIMETSEHEIGNGSRMDTYVRATNSLGKTN